MCNIQKNGKISLYTTKRKLLFKVIRENRLNPNPGIDLPKSRDWESGPELEPLLVP